MTSQEIQELLKQSKSMRKHIWADVVWHCSQRGLDFGENATEKARLKWFYICKALKNAADRKSVGKKAFKTIKIRHLDRLEKFMKSSKHYLNVLDNKPDDYYCLIKNETEDQTGNQVFVASEQGENSFAFEPVALAKNLLIAEQAQIEIDDAKWERREKKFEELETLFKQQTLNWETVANLLISKQQSEHCTV